MASGGSGGGTVLRNLTVLDEGGGANLAFHSSIVK
jgi:hypothetical protein